MPISVDRSLRLPESEYFPDPQEKSGIALHHTVCDGAPTTASAPVGGGVVRSALPDRTAASALVGGGLFRSPLPAPRSPTDTLADR